MEAFVTVKREFLGGGVCFCSDLVGIIGKDTAKAFVAGGII